MNIVPKNNFQRVRNIVFCFLVCIFVTHLMGFIYHELYLWQTIHSQLEEASSEPFKFKPFEIFTDVVQTPIWEELYNRLIPIEIAIIIGTLLDKKKRDTLLILTIVYFSIVFGWNHNGVTSVYIQGVHGLLFSALYIINGRWRSGYISIVAVHFLINLYGTLYPLIFN